MLRGIYSAASGMGTQLDAVNVYANNIANAATNGFKRSELVTRPFSELVVQLGGSESGNLGLGVGPTYAKMDLRQAGLISTANPMNFALQGEGYFQVEATNPDGSTQRLVTRDGNFTIDSQGRLTNSHGHLVLGEGDTAITFAQNNPSAIAVRDDGTVYENDQQVGKIKLVKVAQEEPTTLSPFIPKTVASLQATNEAAEGTIIKQSFLETSNVDVIREMIGLITSSKTYDTAQRLIGISDKTLDRTINEMGRIQ